MVQFSISKCTYLIILEQCSYDTAECEVLCLNEWIVMVLCVQGASVCVHTDGSTVLLGCPPPL